MFLYVSCLFHFISIIFLSISSWCSILGWSWILANFHSFWVPGRTTRKVWMKTAARVQVPYNPEVPQYVEGHEDFNVWYGKYLSDRRNPRDKDRYSAGHTCDPEKDSGWTQADLPGSGSPGFCLFYARGCCGFGHKCRSLVGSTHFPKRHSSSVQATTLVHFSRSDSICLSSSLLEGS